MGRITFANARVWRYMMNAIGKIVEEAACTFGDEGLRLRAMDPSHVAMIDLLIPTEAFEEYDVGKGESITFTLEDINKVFRRVGKHDSLTLEWGEGRLAIALSGRLERTFRIPMPTIEVSELPEPKLEFHVKARMLSKNLREGIKDVEPVADVITLTASSEGFKITGRSERGEAQIILTVESGALLELEVKEESTANYSIEYLSDTLPAAQISDVAEVSFSTNMPCMIRYELPGGGYLSFIIAPRVE